MLSTSAILNALRGKSVYLVLLATALLSSACVTPLSVRRHSTVSLSNSEASSILADFSELVHTADSTGDFACAEDFNSPPFIDGVLPAHYTRSGNVGTYAATGNINSEAAFDTVIATPGYVKVANSITWCGGFGANILGCAPVGGTSFAVVRRNSLEEIIWAHEYGHTVGLNHRADSDAIMNASLLSSMDEVTSDECVAFVSRAMNNPFNESGIDTGAGSAMTTRRVEANAVSTTSASGRIEFDSHMDLGDDLAVIQSELKDVADFVRQVYIHGTPVDQALQFKGEENAKILVSMLADKRESEHWGNIVFTLGLIGGDQDVPHVIDYLEIQLNERMDWTQVRQSTAGLMGLGYLANQTGSLDAIDYLAERASSGGGSLDPEMADALADGAAIGLAMVGSEESLFILDEIYKGKSGPGRSTVGIPLDELIDLNLEIQDLGIQNYFTH